MKKRVKRLLSILLMCSILASVCGLGMVNASEGYVTVRADSVHVQAGERFEVPIQMIGGQGIMGFSVSFSYDETAMKPISVSPADGIGGGWENSIETSKSNSFSVVWYGTENITAQGTVFTLTFEALANASGEYSISMSYDQASTFDEAWEDVALRTDAISVRIDNENPSPRFLIPDASVEAGDMYLCDVAVQNNTGLGIVSFTLFFDATAMTPTEVRDGKGAVLSSNLSGSSGTVQVILDRVAADNTDGVLFTVVFQTAANRKGSFPIAMTNSANYVCKTGALTLHKDVQTGVPMVDVQQDVEIVNDLVTVPIHISNNTGIMGLRLRLTIDSAKFSLASCERGSALNSGMFDYKFNDATGVIDILWSSSEASYINDVCCVLKIQIQDKSATTLELAMGYEQEDTFDEKLNNVSLACENAEIPLYCLVIHADSSSINVGETLQLSATMKYVQNQPTAVTWTSSDTHVADIAETGLVRGLSRGIAIITADDGNGHTATVSIQIMPVRPELQLFSADGSYERKIDWWKRYSTSTMMLGYIAYKCEDAVNYEWSSSNKRVHIDQNGNITNTGCFARSADITLTAYDAIGNVIASSTVTVRFYKFDWQYTRLYSQEVVSDNVFRQTVVPAASESETFSCFVSVFLSKMFAMII